jgi:hypothetical protein
MTTDEIAKLIPQVVVEAVASVIANDDGWGFTAYEETARDAIAAGLAKWPGVVVMTDTVPFFSPHLALPLTQEKPND